MEKGLLYAVVAVVMLAGLIQLGNTIHRFYTELNCKMSQATICIIEKPNKE